MSKVIDDHTGTLANKLSLPRDPQPSLSGSLDIDSMSRQEIHDVLTRRLVTSPPTRFTVLAHIIDSASEAALRRLAPVAFFKSVYWNVVREFVRYARGRCDECGATRGLWVVIPGRHTGSEHREMERLRVLCKQHVGRE